MKVDLPKEWHIVDERPAKGTNLIVWEGQKDGVRLQAKVTKKHDVEWLTLWKGGCDGHKLEQITAVSGYTSKEKGIEMMRALCAMYVEGKDKSELEAEKAKHGFGKKSSVKKRPSAKKRTAAADEPVEAVADDGTKSKRSKKDQPPSVVHDS
eukprot:3694676-Pyramimonas_sp.AAC.1